MDIFINNQKHTVAEKCTLQTIITIQLGDRQKGVAVAINDTVIPRSNWEKQAIQLNDHILIIKASQGG